MYDFFHKSYNFETTLATVYFLPTPYERNIYNCIKVNCDKTNRRNNRKTSKKIEWIVTRTKATIRYYAQFDKDMNLL